MMMIISYFKTFISKLFGFNKPTKSKKSTKSTKSTKNEKDKIIYLASKYEKDNDAFVKYNNYEVVFIIPITSYTEIIDDEPIKVSYRESIYSWYIKHGINIFNYNVTDTIIYDKQDNLIMYVMTITFTD